MRILVLALALFLICPMAYAGQKYNPHTRQWETVPNNWSTKYNPHNRDWSYQPPKAQPEYNPHQRNWDWNSGHNPNTTNKGGK